MEYINIISKEAITEPAPLPLIIFGGIAIIAIIGTAIWATNSNNRERAMGWAATTEVASLLGFIAVYLICAVFFRVPTGRYEYKATIDKENITVSEYADFIETYNPTVIDGVYYWED